MQQHLATLTIRSAICPPEMLLLLVFTLFLCFHLPQFFILIFNYNLYLTFHLVTANQ